MFLVIFSPYCCKCAGLRCCFEGRNDRGKGGQSPCRNKIATQLTKGRQSRCLNTIQTKQTKKRQAVPECNSGETDETFGRCLANA